MDLSAVDCTGNVSTARMRLGIWVAGISDAEEGEKESRYVGNVGAGSTAPLGFGFPDGVRCRFHTPLGIGIGVGEGWMRTILAAGWESQGRNFED